MTRSVRLHIPPPPPADAKIYHLGELPPLYDLPEKHEAALNRLRRFYLDSIFSRPEFEEFLKTEIMADDSKTIDERQKEIQEMLEALAMVRTKIKTRHLRRTGA